MKFKKTLASLGALAIAGAALIGTDTLDDVFGGSDAGTAEAGTDQNNDYFTVDGEAVLEHSPNAGEIGYCDIDDLGRAGCAYGSLTSDVRHAAQTAGRQDITADPAGWPESNEEVEIPAVAGVTGSTDYHGWFYNRSHLLADSLGGSTEGENLVTGTRAQNVGSYNNSGGMAYTETIARDYLDGNNANDCPLYYAAVPNYTDDELVPRTVTVDIQSCDQKINQRVIVDNTANGWAINYSTGAYEPEK